MPLIFGNTNSSFSVWLRYLVILLLLYSPLLMVTRTLWWKRPFSRQFTCWLFHFVTYGPDPSKRLLNLILFCIFLISAFSFFTINTIGRQYNRRLNLLSSILASQQKPKVIANYSDFQKEILMLNHWNTGIDALIIAKCKLKDSKTIFFTEDKNSFSYDTSDVNLFLGPLWWTMWNNKTMDSAYFYLPPSTYVLYPDLESK